MNVYNIKQTISTYFRENNLSYYKLDQVYILYVALQNIGKAPTIVKGYLVNHLIRNYYISFWIVCDGELHNIIDETLTYSLDENTELVETLPYHIQSTYLNMNKSDICLNLNVSDTIYDKVKPLLKYLKC